ncbi:MAG: helix-turn-helix domain-containing protein [Planctomycetes bacterium]|nr:helix-turn-helix domain-containing protein [Planctomycetota bacterium]
MTTRVSGARRPRDTYFELVRRFPLRPIRSELELDRATEVIDELLSRPRLDADEADYLDVLSDLTEKYEEEKHPMPPASDAEMLAFLIEQKGVTQAEVSRATGMAVSTLCEILSGKRTVPRFKIGKLAAYFHVSPAVFAFEK